jgi:hypothetical protein
VFRSGRRRHDIQSLIASNLTGEGIAGRTPWYPSTRITARLPA